VTAKNWWIKEYRRKIGLSQEKLAELVGSNNDKIGRIERGKQDLTVEEITAFGSALKLSKEEIGSILFQVAGVTTFDIMKFLPDVREEKRFEIETHVAGICMMRIKQGVRILIAKRLNTRDLYPGKWESGGGQVKPGENFEEAIKRQMREEFGIEVKILTIIATYEILTPKLPQKKIPGLKFLCTPANDKIAEGIKINPKEFSEHKWITEYEIDQFDFIRGVKKDILKALEYYKSQFTR
jgi:8-oxo-dGTP diphosphatase